MKLHYLAEAANVATWRGATPIIDAPCGTRSSRRSNDPLLATSNREAVTCKKCKASM